MQQFRNDNQAVETPGASGRIVPLHAEANILRKAQIAPARRIVYVVSMFPIWSETFIVREIHALLEQGVDIRIVSLRRPKRGALVQDDARALLDRVIYHRGWYENLASMMRDLLHGPLTLLRHPAEIVRGMWKTPLSMAKSLVTWFRTIGLVDEVRKFDPDHVHAHWATYPSTSAMVMADRLKCSFSVTAHAHDIYLEDHLMEQKLDRARFIATISEYNRRFLRQRYPSARHARIEIVHCGVAPKRTKRERVAAKRTVPVLLSVGRHDEVKGFPTLLKACRILKERGRRFRCQIIGDGPLRRSIENQISDMGLEKTVELLGVQPGDVVAAKLSDADVFVLASERASNGNMDGIPVALMEAMQMKTPVVSTEISGIPELVEDGVTGLLASPGDAVSLADALERMLEDSALRERCTEAAERKVSREFDAKREATRLLSIFRTNRGEKNAEEAVDHH